MAIRLHLLVDQGHYLARIDQKGAAFDPQEGFSIHRLFLQDSIGLSDLLFRVAKQIKGQVVLLVEPLLLPETVRAYAQDDHVQLLATVIGITEPGCFYRSTGCIGLWKEVENHRTA